MERLKQAINLRPREAFLPKEVFRRAKANQALPIGYGQTNSEPGLVYDMLDNLKIEPGNKVLDVGCGSGWTTSLIGYLVGPKGQVIGTERIPKLAKFAESNCKKFAHNNITVFNTPTGIGYPDQAPYDRILVSAAARELPQELIGQLGDNSIMIVPVKDRLVVIIKENNTIKIKPINKYRVLFVPLIY